MNDAQLASHQPTEAVRRRAARQGVDLDALRLERPSEYKMLNAVELLEISAELETPVAEAFFAAAPEHDLFSLPTESLPTESLPTESLPTESLPTESLPTESLPTESLSTQGVGALRLLVFPEPDRDTRVRFDAALERLVERPDMVARYLYFREIKDHRGERRELALPCPVDGWQGEETMVGPFDAEADVHHFARRKVLPTDGLGYDAVTYRDGWFCDVFRADGGG